MNADKVLIRLAKNVGRRRSTVAVLFLHDLQHPYALVVARGDGPAALGHVRDNASGHRASPGLCEVWSRAVFLTDRLSAPAQRPWLERGSAA